MPGPETSRRTPVTGALPLPLVLLLVAIGLTITVVSLLLLFRAELQDQELRLQQIARVQARFIEAVGAFDAEFSEEDNPGGWFGATLSQVREAQGTAGGWGESGRLHLATLAGDSLVHLLVHQADGGREAEEGWHAPELEAALRRAQAGASGSGIGHPAGRGSFLMAFEPVRLPDRTLGLATTMDLAEIRRPFVRMGIIIFGLTLALILLGAFLVRAFLAPTTRALKESEWRYRRLVADLGEAVFITTRDGTILECNRASADLLGVSQEALVGRKAGEFYQDPAQREELLERLDLHGRVSGMELALEKDDGTPLHCLSTIHFRAGEGTEDQTLETVLTDITGLKRAQEVLADSEARYFDMFEHAPDMLLSVDPERYQVRECNAAVLDRLGYSRDEVLGSPVSKFCASESQEAIRELDRLVAATGAAEGVELDLLRSDGFQIPVSMNAVAVWDDEGRRIADRLSARDVSEERELTRRLDRILEATQDGLWEWPDPDREELWWSDGFFRLLGYEPGSVQPTLSWFNDLIHPEDREEVGRRTSALLLPDGETSIETEYRIRRADGTYAWLRTRGRVYRTAEGTPTHLAGSVRDITGRIELELELERTADHLAQAQTVARVGSWERNYLTDEIRWSAQMAEIFGRDPEDEVPSMEAILEQAHPEDRDRAEAALDEARRTGTYAVEYRILRHDDGSERVVAAQGHVEQDADGNPVRHLGVALDVTEQRQADAALAHAQMRAQQYLDIAEVMLLALDEQGRIEMINRKGCEVLGVEEEDILGQNWFDVALPEGIRVDVKGRFAEIMAGDVEPMRYYENPIVSASGEERIIAWHNAPMQDSDGGIRGTFSSGADVTEQRRAEEALRASEELLRRTGEMARVGGWEVDFRTGKVTWSRVTKMIHEVPLDHEPTLEEAYTYFPPGDRERLGEAFDGAVEEGTPYDLEVRFITAKGTELWTRTMGQPVFEDGECVRIWGTFHDITARKETEEVARKNQERLELAQRVGRVGLMDRNLAQDEEVWSPVTFEILGLAPEETVPGPAAWLEAVHPDDRLKATRALGRLLHGEDPAPEEYRVVHPSGEVRWVRGVARAFHSEEGLPFGRVLATLLDVTELKKTEMALRESETRWTVLFENMRDGWVSTDLEGHFLHCNQAFLELVGRSREELEGVAYQDLTPEEFREWEEEIVREKVLGEGFSGIYEKEYLRRDGNRVPVELAVYPLEDLEGRIVGLWGLARDITARKVAEAALRDSEERFRSIFEASPLGITLTEPEGSLIAVNPQFAEMLGYFPEDLVGRAPEELTDARDVEPSRTLTRALLAGKGPGFQVEKRYVKQDGSPLWASLTTAPVQGPDGSVLYGIAMVEDISEWKRAREELQSSERRLRALAARLARIREEERTAISRELHDELGQSLTGLRMDLAMERSELPDDQSALAARFTSLIQTADETVDLVRDLSSRLRPPILDVMGLGPAVEWQVDEARPRTGCTFHVDVIEERIPLPEGHDIAVLRIAQEALTNIIRHAEAENVWVSLKRDGPRLILRVEDDGRGFDVEGAKATSSLGLLGMQERALAIGGSLLVEPRVEGGTVVQLILDTDVDIETKDQA